MQFAFLFPTLLRMEQFTSSFGELDLGLTLRAGQVFGWEYSPELNQWIGAIDCIAYRLSQDVVTGAIAFRHNSQNSAIEGTYALKRLQEFFQMHLDLPSMIGQWSEMDSVFDKLIGKSKFSGLRICKQSPFECLISFIVSANNNIKRIQQNLYSIRRKYGTLIQEETNTYAFPTPQELSRASPEELRKLGLGYRAEYIVKTVSMLLSEEVYSKLLSLEEETDSIKARDFLVQFQGVGRKVADCVMLYSLGFSELAPVDTHMFQIAQRLFPSAKLKKDNAMHDRVQSLMVERYGSHAGFAHCFLFAADLKDLQDPVPPSAKKGRLDSATTSPNSSSVSL
jgi:N-glycosylase/DNA lyase